MRYVTINELSQTIKNNLWQIPRDIDLVVGVPRSGMLAAEMISLYLNVRLSDVDSFANGRIYSVGETRSDSIQMGHINHVLVVDDSINSGMSMSHVREKLQPLQSEYRWTYMAVVASSEGVHYVDISMLIIDDERIFEWNLFHHGYISRAFLDMDGILCEDPTEDDDGERYNLFLETAKPRFIPTVEIDTIITCRLEKYRQQTELWLSKHNVRYRHLIMLDMPTRDARRKWGKHGEWKGLHYRRSGCILFIESSSSQARQIASSSGKPVIDFESDTLLVYPKMPLRRRIKRKISRLSPTLFSIIFHAKER